MPTINSVARRVLPDRVWNTVRSVAGHRLVYDQVAELRSGLRLRVKDHPDWAVFVEVFVQGGYDRPIRDTIRDAAARDAAARAAGGAGRPVVVLDLGANAGFFTLRVVDLLRQEAPGVGARVVAVEAGDRPARKFRDRVFGENGLGREVALVRGLVGRREGSAAFVEYPATTNSNVFDETLGGPLGGAAVDYVDLEDHVGPGPVDLVKCDVEGSEWDFLRSYGPLLARTRRVVVELHEAFVDYAACRAVLRDAGFILVETDVAGPCETDYWVRGSVERAGWDVERSDVGAG